MTTNRGYTLTELMIVVAIVGILASASSVLMVQVQRFFINTSARTETERDARVALATIDRYLRQAVRSSIIIDTPPGQGHYSRIRFSLVDGRLMQFFQSGNRLLQVIDATTSVVSRNLQYLAFSFPDTSNPTILNVSLAMAKGARADRKVLQMGIQKVRIMN